MAKLSLCLALVLALMSFISFGNANPQLGRNPIRITTLPPMYDCKSAKFKEYNKKCCNVNANLLFLEADMKSCDPKLGKDNLTAVEEYIMNTFQNKDKGNQIDYTDKNNIKAIAMPACFVECLFKKIRAMVVPDDPASPITYDDTVLTTYLQAQAQSIWKTPIADSITKCKGLVPSFEPTKVTTSGKPPATCQTMPLSYMQCLRFELIGRCPVAQEKVNPPPDCSAGTAAQDKCASVYTTTAAPSK